MPLCLVKQPTAYTGFMKPVLWLPVFSGVRTLLEEERCSSSPLERQTLSCWGALMPSLVQRSFPVLFRIGTELGCLAAGPAFQFLDGKVVCRIAWILLLPVLRYWAGFSLIWFLISPSVNNGDNNKPILKDCFKESLSPPPPVFCYAKFKHIAKLKILENLHHQDCH